MQHLGAWAQPGLKAAALPASYSIKGEFSGATVLITGASGYIGSVVLEQLLRTTDVATVYLLLRARRGQSIQERADKLLQGALFHKVREQSKVLSKVKVVGGDISLPGLGLSPADRAVLVSSVNFIVHCAADIRLEADIQETLTSNYEGTRTVLELAAAAQQLHGLVHVSSAFVNMNMPRGSIIDEAVYPLRLGRQVVDVEQIAKEFLESPKAEANQRAETYKQLWNFPNTYTLGKHMSEQLVTRYQAQLQLPVAIVRPSLTSAIAGEPYPGYVGNWAGPIGAAAAMAVGMFDTLSSVASQPTGVWDIVPADLVASSILAAAAAVSAGAAAAVSHATQSGIVKGTVEERRVVMGYPHPLAAQPSCSGRDLSRGARADVTAKIHFRPAAHCKADAAGEVDAFRGHRDQLSDVVDSDDACSSNSSPKLLVGIAPSTECRSCSSTDDIHSRSSSIGEEAVALLRPGEQQRARGQVPLLVVHAATSSTYPLVLMESWNMMLEFLEAHPPPFRMVWGKLSRMTAAFEPNMDAVMAARRRVSWKVWALAKLMRLLGKDKEARKLEVGFDAFCVQNNSKTDRQLVFSTDALVALEAALNPAEAADYLLVWRPMTNRPVTNPASGATSTAAAAGAQQRGNSTGGKKGKKAAAVAAATAAAAAAAAAAVPAGRAERALSPVAGDVTWRRYLNTQMAAVYRVVFGVEVQQRQLTAAAAAFAGAGGQQQRQLTNDDYILHDFVKVK